MAVSKKTININGTYALYFVIFILVLLLTIVSTLLYYANNKKEDKKAYCPKVDNCHCPKVDVEVDVKEIKSSIPVYPKELPTYEDNSVSSVSRVYQQVGILTSNDSDSNEPTILPLFSKRANNHRDRCNYYTTTDKNTMLRLPIRHDNMNCDDDIGCNEIYDGNTLYIEMYKGKTFTATIYKKQTPSYFADKY
jgi:hypothetical protein